MIFGLDLGTRRVAAACPQVGWTFSVDISNTRGKREFPSEHEAGAELGRLLAEALWLERFTSNFQEHHFFWERPMVFKNVRTAIGQSISFGALSTHLPGTLHEIENKVWKKVLCGNGNASKDDTRRWLEEHQPALAAACGEDGDLFDATCIGLYGESVLAQEVAL